MLTRRDFIRQLTTGAAVGALESIVSSSSNLSAQSTQSQTQLPSQFDIFYSYSQGSLEEKNSFNSRTSLYVVDMVCDPSRSYKVILTDSEKKAIYDAVLQNDFFNIKDDLTNGCNDRGECMGVFPRHSFTLEVTIDGRTKTVKYRPEFGWVNPNDRDVRRYTEVVKVIEDILSKKREELNVPRVRCVYG